MSQRCAPSWIAFAFAAVAVAVAPARADEPPPVEKAVTEAPPAEVVAPVTPTAPVEPNAKIQPVSPAAAPALITAPAIPPEAPAGAPLYKRASFWIALAAGALTVGTLVYGVVFAATFTPRYALVSF